MFNIEGKKLKIITLVIISKNILVPDIFSKFGQISKYVSNITEASLNTYLVFGIKIQLFKWIILTTKKTLLWALFSIQKHFWWFPGCWEMPDIIEIHKHKQKWMEIKSKLGL